jgi:CCR4-NOT transcription complex subunit 1
VLATAAFRVLLHLPESSRDGSEKTKVNLALTQRFSKQNQPLPQMIRSAMALPDLLETKSDLAQELLKSGPSAIVTIEATKEFLRRYGRVNLDDEQVASAIMFIVLNSFPDTDPYRLNNLIEVIRDQYSNIINWENVVRAFDKEFFMVDQAQFLTLYRALLPIAKEDNALDIQLLWSGHRQHAASQLAFAISFASLSPAQLDATLIPNLRLSFDLEDAQDAPKEIRALVEQASHDPMISLEAVTAIIEALWSGSNHLSQQDILNARHVISEKMALFVCSAAGIPKPWTQSHQQFLQRTVSQCLMKSQDHYSFILHILWKQDKNWLHEQLMLFHSEDPIKLPLLIEHAQEHGWLQELCTTVTGFGIDLAAIAHRKDLINIQDWAEDKLRQNRAEFTSALSKFLIIKTQDEMRTLRMEQSAPRTVSLAMKTVHAMLEILEQYAEHGRDSLNDLERHCMQAFPRLCNYGEGFDHVIEENGAESNALPPNADAAMQERYKLMYSGELEVRQVIEGLRDCKTSEDPEKQDLFACMIHGLFDEYVCFHEYPLGPLAKTAVLFGGIINYRLINHIALNVALEMVLESVRDYPSESPMFKFGLQALLHFLGRLPEWPDYCQRLVQIHGLQGTEPNTRAQEVVRDRPANGTNDADGLDDLLSTQRMTNGNSEEFMENASLVAQFRSINVDSIPYPEKLEDPEEEVQDKVLFVLNNVSSENLSSKIHDLSEVLEPKHYQWFATYIVEQRAKSQPNYQQLYLDLLGLLNDKGLWADVLRETYASVRKVMNAESTMKMANERTYLKNLGTWLGSLTIARDKPIKHKNIAFKELLLEGWETARLLLVIPFTCEVLAQGVRSVVFKPPNPWIMEIIGLLLELYDLPDLKIQQKFAIEILLGAFGLPRKGEGMERGNDLKKRQQMFDTQISDPMAPDGIDAFDEMGISNINKGIRNPRFTPPALPDLENMLVLPPASSSPLNQAHLRRLVQNAVKRSIEDIISPVVERSITIATISTKELIQKDFAQEGDENRIREAFEQMVKALAGSLASVTCKEPLRMSMNTYIRNAAAEMPEQPLPEGSILMCVNDNLDMACKIVEKQAEERALLEIEPAIEVEVNKRRQHKLEYPNDPFRDTATSHWATFIPEPYKQVAGGLNQQQMDIYQHFAPQPRGAVSHLPNASTDSTKQLPDVLQEAFPTVPNLPTPAEAPALPHQTHQQPQGRLLPPSIASTRPPSQVNGYMDGPSLWEHIQECLTDIIRHCREASEDRMRDLTRESPLSDAIGRFMTLVRSASQDSEQIAYQTATAACQALYSEGVSLLEAEVLTHFIKSLCPNNETFSGKLLYILRTQAEDRILNVPATAALLSADILDYIVVDSMLASAIRVRNHAALQCFAALLDVLLFVKNPPASRSDFSRSFGALGEWMHSGEECEIGDTINKKLAEIEQDSKSALQDIGPLDTTQYELQYLYEQWFLNYIHSEGQETILIAFLIQLGRKSGISTSSEGMIKFLRFCIEVSIKDCDRLTKANHLQNQESANQYVAVDAVAKMIILLVKTRDDTMITKAHYLKTILQMIALILMKDQEQTQARFNQRPYLRMFSSILYFWHENVRGDPNIDKGIILAFGEVLLLLQPVTFPGFAFGWLSLVSHQAFMASILKIGGNEVG